MDCVSTFLTSYFAMSTMTDLFLPMVERLSIKSILNMFLFFCFFKRVLTFPKINWTWSSYVSLLSPWWCGLNAAYKEILIAYVCIQISSLINFCKNSVYMEYESGYYEERIFVLVFLEVKVQQLPLSSVSWVKKRGKIISHRSCFVCFFVFFILLWKLGLQFV